MKKDGTRYLALLRVKMTEIDDIEKYGDTKYVERWEIIHWGKPSGISDPFREPCWCNQTLFGMKFEEVLKHANLNDVLEDI